MELKKCFKNIEFKKKLKIKQQKGITLIALIVTIIILLILAGVTIAMLTGENGLLGRAEQANYSMEIARFRDDASLAYMELYTNNAQEYTYEVAEDDWVDLLEEKYDYSISQSGARYFVSLNEMYYPISLNGSNIVIGEGCEEASITTYTVSFNTNEGSSVDSQTVESGGRAIMPATNPTKEGFVFAGWFSDIGLTSEYDFNTTINTDTTIYAKWAKSLNIVYGEMHDLDLEVKYDDGMTWRSWASSNYAHDLKIDSGGDNVVFSLVTKSYPMIEEGRGVSYDELISDSNPYFLEPEASNWNVKKEREVYLKIRE